MTGTLYPGVLPHLPVFQMVLKACRLSSSKCRSIVYASYLFGFRKSAVLTFPTTINWTSLCEPFFGLVQHRISLSPYSRSQQISFGSVIFLTFAFVVRKYGKPA